MEESTGSQQAYGNVIEVRADVFERFEEELSKGKKVGFVHCISADVKMGRGVAQQFISRYGKEHRQKIIDGMPLEESWLAATKVLDGQGTAYHLITKSTFRGKPTLSIMEKCLKRLSERIKKDDIKLLVMPRIGCGLDRLRWEDVLPLVKKMGVKCIVCTL